MKNKIFIDKQEQQLKISLHQQLREEMLGLMMETPKTHQDWKDLNVFHRLQRVVLSKEAFQKNVTLSYTMLMVNQKNFVVDLVTNQDFG